MSAHLHPAGTLGLTFRVQKVEKTWQSRELKMYPVGLARDWETRKLIKFYGRANLSLPSLDLYLIADRNGPILGYCTLAVQVFPEIAPITENNMVYNLSCQLNWAMELKKCKLVLNLKYQKFILKYQLGHHWQKTPTIHQMLSLCVCLTVRPKNKCWN